MAADESIVKISQEYSFNALMKAELMRNRPKVPSFYEEQPTAKSSLSPHYRRARELQKTLASVGGDYVASKAALVNAHIELNHLMN